MKRFILIALSIFILSYTLFAQIKTKIINDQQCPLHPSDELDAIVNENICIAINVKGFYGPYINKQENGLSKTYWYDRDYSDNSQNKSISSVYLYCGDCCDVNISSLFGVVNPSIIQTIDCTVSRGEVDDLYFRVDNYYNGKLFIMYSYVRKEDVSFFDSLLDHACLKPYSTRLFSLYWKKHLFSKQFDYIYVLVKSFDNNIQALTNRDVILYYSQQNQMTVINKIDKSFLINYVEDKRRRKVIIPLRGNVFTTSINNGNTIYIFDDIRYWNVLLMR